MSVISFSLVEDAMRMLKCTVSVIFLFVSIFLLLSMIAEASSDSSVETEINIIIDNGASFNVEYYASVDYITLAANEIKYSREDIRNAGPELLGAIKYALKSDFVAQMKSSFPNCNIGSLNELPQYSSDEFYDEFSVVLTADFFSLNKTIFSSDLINGLLDSGVYVNYSFPWTSLPGWNNTYSLILSDTIGYKRTNGDVDNTKISWDIFNQGADEKQEIGTITLKDFNPTTDASQNETVSLVFSLDCRKPEDINLTMRLKAHRLDMSFYECLPSILTLPSSLPADAIRLCVASNLTTYNQIKKNSLISYINDSLNSLKESSFNQSFNFNFLWDVQTTENLSSAYDIHSMDENPPITGLINDPSVEIYFHNISGRALFGLINSGATSNISKESVNFADVFDTQTLNVTSELHLPTQVLLNQSNHVTWKNSNEFMGEFTSENPPKYYNGNINRVYSIDVKSTDLNLLSFFTGKTEVNLGVGFEKTRNIHVMKQLETLSIPEQIKLSYINADAFRLCVEEGVFSAIELSEYLENHASELENTSRRLFPSIKGSSVNNQKIFDESLSWDKNISSMNAENPIKISQFMESTAPLSCQFSIIPPSFSFATQNLTFVGVPEETVTYNMTFPKGISIEILSSSPQISNKIVENGKTQITVQLNASENGKVVSMVFSMKPTLLYIIGLFVPCIISVIITILLFFVVFLIRKKRNKFRQNKQIPPRSDQEGYENEDYYVPPKPPSSR